MKKFLTINSRVMFAMAILIYITWMVTSISEIDIVLAKALPKVVSDCLYPFLFMVMFGCFLASLFMWIEEMLNKSSSKVAM